MKGRAISPPLRFLGSQMKPIFLILLIIGIPALLGIIYIFVRGSTGLRRYTLTRIGLTLPMIFILATVVFLILRVLPGDPVSSALGPKGTPEMIQRIRQQLGLNDPMIVQYGRFLSWHGHVELREFPDRWPSPDH